MKKINIVFQLVILFLVTGCATTNKKAELVKNINSVQKFIESKNNSRLIFKKLYLSKFGQLKLFTVFLYKLPKNFNDYLIPHNKITCSHHNFEASNQYYPRNCYEIAFEQADKLNVQVIAVDSFSQNTEVVEKTGSYSDPSANFPNIYGNKINNSKFGSYSLNNYSTSNYGKINKVSPPSVIYPRSRVHHYTYHMNKTTSHFTFQLYRAKWPLISLLELSNNNLIDTISDIRPFISYNHVLGSTFNTLYPFNNNQVMPHPSDKKLKSVNDIIVKALSKLDPDKNK